MVASGLEDAVELVRLLGGGGLAATTGGGGGTGDRDGGGGGDVEGVLELLHELGQLDEGHLLEGLKEAKDLVDGTPKPVLEKVNKEAADKAKAALEGAGATVTVK
jgi:large subunit ribosomal protein L7/L12